MWYVLRPPVRLCRGSWTLSAFPHVGMVMVSFPNTENSLHLQHFPLASESGGLLRWLSCEDSATLLFPVKHLGLAGGSNPLHVEHCCWLVSQLENLLTPAQVTVTLNTSPKTEMPDREKPAHRETDGRNSLRAVLRSPCVPLDHFQIRDRKQLGIL